MPWTFADCITKPILLPIHIQLSHTYLSHSSTDILAWSSTSPATSMRAAYTLWDNSWVTKVLLIWQVVCRDQWVLLGQGQRFPLHPPQICSCTSRELQCISTQKNIPLNLLYEMRGSLRFFPPPQSRLREALTILQTMSGCRYSSYGIRSLLIDLGPKGTIYCISTSLIR